MIRVIVMAEIEDAKTWEAGFRAHGGLFQDMTQRVAHYCITERNEVIIYLEVDDPEKYRSVMLSREVGDAMLADGVKRDTVRFYVLDRTLES